jgi:hypothetical protein
MAIAEHFFAAKQYPILAISTIKPDNQSLIQNIGQ